MFLQKVHLLQHFIVEVILRTLIFISRTILHLSTCHLCTSNFPLCFVQCQWNEQVMESDFTKPMKCDCSKSTLAGPFLHKFSRMAWLDASFMLLEWPAISDLHLVVRLFSVEFRFSNNQWWEAQPVSVWMGGVFGGESIHVYVWLNPSAIEPGYSPDTVTTMLTGSTSIQNETFKKS